jgi:hypothetical protein
MPHTFAAHFVRCKHSPCDGSTRLPKPNPLDTESSLINSPTVSQPLLILCTHCWKLSRYSKADFQEGWYPDIALSADTPIYLAEIVCGEKSCGLPTKVYMRDNAALQQHAQIAIANVIHVLGDDKTKCPAGHSLSGAQGTLRPILETT